MSTSTDMWTVIVGEIKHTRERQFPLVETAVSPRGNARLLKWKRAYLQVETSVPASGNRSVLLQTLVQVVYQLFLVYMLTDEDNLLHAVTILFIPISQ